MTAVIAILFLIGAGIAGALVFGTVRWEKSARDFRAKLEAAPLPPRPVRFNPGEIEDLPAPVRRYLRAVLPEGQPAILTARLSQEGEFRLSETKESWGPFRATHVAKGRPPAFDWDARIRFAPGISVYVRDAYADGRGMLHASILGLKTVADQRGTPELAEGELMRWLAEAVWYPTALLPGNGVRWEALDGSRARANLTDGNVTVSLEFRFDAEGLVTGVRSPGRYRDVGGVPTLTPWEGRFGNYALRSGMRIPLTGEVAWILPGGALTYWRGRITDIAFELAG